MSDAIPISSSSVLSAIKQIRKKPVIEDKELRDEKALLTLSRSRGWKVLKKMIQAEIDRLISMNTIDTNDNIESIGIKFIASQLAKEKLEWILQSVKYTAEANKPQT